MEVSVGSPQHKAIRQNRALRFRDAGQEVFAAQRGKSKPSRAVARGDEPDEPVAESAAAIVKENFRHGKPAVRALRRESG